MDVIDSMERAYRYTGAIVAGLTPSQATAPTPCAQFDVHALFGHVVDTLDMFTIALGGTPDGTGDDAFTDPATTYKRAVAANLAAWRNRGDVDGTLTMPFGEIPASVGAHLSTIDVLVHGWDLARATGQPTALPEDLATSALSFTRQMLRPEMRSDAPDATFGLEVAVPDDAPVTDQLVAFLGRRP
jgi:uncharacterized protein (TIGR03086 family)